MSAVLIPTASEAEWLEARRHGVTASEIAVLMGLSPYDSPYGLYHRKLGILPADDDQAAFERGRVLEPYIAAKFAGAHPELFVTGTGRDLYASIDRPWQLATPDRLININRIRPGEWLRGTTGSVLETKTDDGSQEWGEPGTDEIPVHYRCQVLWQMDVMGVSEAHVSCLRIHDWRIREYVIRHAEGCGPGRNMLAYPSLACPACDDIVIMRDEARDFLGRIDAREPPDVDWRPATITALKTMHASVEDREVHVGRQLEISYRAAVRRAKEAERRKDEMTARMLLAMGDARRAVAASTVDAKGDRIVIATRSVSHPERIDTAKLRSAYPAIAAECTRPSKPEVKLTPAKPKRES